MGHWEGGEWAEVWKNGGQLYWSLGKKGEIHILIEWNQSLEMIVLACCSSCRLAHCHLGWAGPEPNSKSASWGCAVALFIHLLVCSFIYAGPFTYVFIQHLCARLWAELFWQEGKRHTSSCCSRRHSVSGGESMQGSCANGEHCALWGNPKMPQSWKWGLRWVLRDEEGLAYCRRRRTFWAVGQGPTIGLKMLFQNIASLFPDWLEGDWYLWG